MPVYQDDDISKAVSAARQPNLVTEDDVAGTWSPRSNPTQGQTVNSYSPATEAAPLGFGERLSNALYNRFVKPAISAVTAPGRVYRGEVPEDQMIDEAKNMAGQVMLGSFGVGVPSALREGIDPNVLRSGFGGAERALMRSSPKEAKLPINLIPEPPQNRNTQVFPQLQERYPLISPPVEAVDKISGKPYLAKQLSDEALAVQKARIAAQKDIDAGNYNPYFKLSERADVDPADYPEHSFETTQILKQRPETVEKYEALARSPEGLGKLTQGYQKGLEQKENAENWYFMKQLQDEFVKEYGPEQGKSLFKERFADPMAATTGGADPTSNLMMAHYGNYLKNQGINQIPPSYEMPFPIGGRYVTGNMDQFRKMIMEGAGIDPVANPKRYNFSGNFLGKKGATLDEQMSGAWDPKMGMPPTGSYGHYESALADEAAKLGADPRYFQEVAWAGLKDAKTKGGFKAQPMIGIVNEAIERTSRLTGMPPEEVVRRGLVRSEIPLYGAAGFAAINGLNSSSNESEPNFKRGGRTLANNAIDNALRLATGGDADSSQPDAPISLQDLKDWKKAHPLSLNKNAMDDIFTSRQSGFEGAEPIAMPADLNELMAYLRRKHHADGGRAHFGFGGDTDSDSHPESGQTGTVSAERSAEAQTQQDNSAAARQDAERASVDNARGQSAGEQMGQMGRGAGEGNGLAAAIGDSSGGVFGFGSGLNVAKAREAILNEQQAPTDIQDYTTQRLNTPYQGSLLSAAMNPSDAFGMGYGSLVGRQNTRAGAAGFLGSAMGESGKELDPSAINAGSIGMLQETGPRRIGLENTLGIDTSLKGNALRDALAGTQMAQLGYGLNEVQTMPDYRETRNAMATGTNAANVADIALQNFERPTLANQIESAPSREAYAQGIMAGRPSGATLGVGQYDAAPSSFRDALMSGIKQADQQKSRLSGDNTGAMLAGASVSDASNDPAITAARNAAIADGTTPQFNPYAGFSSEDPAEIARYNAAMNAAGPKNAFADMTLGQRAPNTTTNNAFSNAVQGFGNFLTDRLTPSYDINSPEYNKISQAVDVAREPTGGRGDQVYIPPTTATQVQTAPVAPYTTELGTYNQQLPSVGGMTAAQWAAANTAGDMSKVHGRIKYVNGAPMLEYFTQ